MNDMSLLLLKHGIPREFHLGYRTVVSIRCLICQVDHCVRLIEFHETAREMNDLTQERRTICNRAYPGPAGEFRDQRDTLLLMGSVGSVHNLSKLFHKRHIFYRPSLFQSSLLQIKDLIVRRLGIPDLIFLNLNIFKKIRLYLIHIFCGKLACHTRGVILINDIEVLCDHVPGIDHNNYLRLSLIFEISHASCPYICYFINTIAPKVQAKCKLPLFC